MAKKKSKYHSVAIPDYLVQEALELIEACPFYRSATELFIAGGRKAIKELIELIYKKQQLKLTKKEE
ncbi:MAG: hypothetical protein ACFFBC_00100 [Promethearchaeota archaeon]